MPVPKGKLRLGGMALRNGLLVHGPTHWAAAVRDSDGAVKVASGGKPRFTAFDDVPGVRGLARLAEAFAVIPLVKQGLPEAKLPSFAIPPFDGIGACEYIVDVTHELPGPDGRLQPAVVAGSRVPASCHPADARISAARAASPHCRRSSTTCHRTSRPADLARWTRSTKACCISRSRTASS